MYNWIIPIIPYNIIFVHLHVSCTRKFEINLNNKTVFHLSMKISLKTIFKNSSQINCKLLCSHCQAVQNRLCLLDWQMRNPSVRINGSAGGKCLFCVPLPLCAYIYFWVQKRGMVCVSRMRALNCRSMQLRHCAGNSLRRHTITPSHTIARVCVFKQTPERAVSQSCTMTSHLTGKWLENVSITQPGALARALPASCYARLSSPI